MDNKKKISSCKIKCLFVVWQVIILLLFILPIKSLHSLNNIITILVLVTSFFSFLNLYKPKQRGRKNILWKARLYLFGEPD